MPSFDFTSLFHGPQAALRAGVADVLTSALDAVDPREAVLRHLSVEDGTLHVGGRRHPLAELDRILVLGFGKAAVPMASAVEAVLGERIDGGRVHVKDGHVLRPLERISCSEGSHPLPDGRNVEAARDMLSLGRGLGSRDLVLFLVSGGGSALLCLPAEGLELDDKLTTTQALLACGAPIAEINTVRRHLSGVKGGQLARAFAPAQMVALILSDVVGDPLETIASGPTVGDPTSFADALRVVEAHGLASRLPSRVIEHLRRGVAGEIADTPSPDDPLFRRVRNRIVANNRAAVEAAVLKARALGFETRLLSTTFEGEARELARFFVACAREERRRRSPDAPPLLLLGGGETTVRIRGEGKGGRNQEFALSALVHGLGELEGALAVGFATDGTDGPTDAGGAFADGESLRRAGTRGLDPLDHLERNDSFAFFEGTDDLIRIGATGTNVCDLYLIALA